LRNDPDRSAGRGLFAREIARNSPLHLPRLDCQTFLCGDIDLGFFVVVPSLLTPLLLGAGAIGVAVVNGVDCFCAFNLVFEGVISGGDVFAEGLGTAELALAVGAGDGLGLGTAEDCAGEGVEFCHGR